MTTVGIEIFEFDQGSDEWRAIRAGIPTASEFANVIRTKGRGENGESKTRRTYLLKLAGERLTGEPADSYTNVHMDRGKTMEDEAREFYCFTREVEVRRVGFIRNEEKGCSPDSLIGDDGALEIKTALPHILLDLIDRDQFPPEHKAQCQGVLWVAEREWIDLMVYWPKLPPLVKRMYRDEKYIAELAAAVDQFNAELHELVERIRRYGTKEAA